jgi:hypothetical protein
VKVGDGNEGRVAEQLRRDICLCTLHKPVTLVPCLHSFCAGCYSDWMCKQQTCPDCRAPCGQMGRSHRVHNVVAALVEAHPEFLREQEEIERLDGKDRLSEALARLGSHAPGGAGVVNHGDLCGGSEEEWSGSEEEGEYNVSEGVERLRANESGLVALDVRGSNLGKRGGQAIGQALARNTTLTQLDLHRNSLAEGGGRAIGQALADNTTLTQLNLCVNSLAEGAGRAIALALDVNTTLTRPELGNYKIIGNWELSGGDCSGNYLVGIAVARAIHISWGRRPGVLSRVYCSLEKNKKGKSAPFAGVVLMQTNHLETIEVFPERVDSLCVLLAQVSGPALTHLACCTSRVPTERGCTNNPSMKASGYFS